MKRIAAITLCFGLWIFARGAARAADIYLPFMDPRSGAKVTFSVLDHSRRGVDCSVEYTNTLSNTNFFTPDEQKMLRAIFLKYRNVTTNRGPDGTEQESVYRTNYSVKLGDRTFQVDNWIARFKYPDTNVTEDILFGRGMMAARFRDQNNDGYNLSFNYTESGTLLTFGQVKNNMLNGLLARFNDNVPQTVGWDFRLAAYDGSHLAEYARYTNNMICQDFFVWNSLNGRLVVQAEFQEPFTFAADRSQPR